MSGVPNPTCTNCGKNLTTDDLRRTDCAYCGTLLPHHARAAQQVAVVQQMLADRNGNGIPDAFEGMVQGAQQNAMRQVPPYVQPMVAHYNQIGVQVADQANKTARTVVIAVVVVFAVVFVLALLAGVAVYFLSFPRVG